MVARGIYIRKQGSWQARGLLCLFLDGSVEITLSFSNFVEIRENKMSRVAIPTILPVYIHYIYDILNV